MTTITRAELVKKYRKDFPATKSLFIRLDDIIIEIRISAGKLYRYLENYFKDFLASKQKSDILITAHECGAVDLNINYTVKQPDPGKIKIKEEFCNLSDGKVVRKMLTGMIFAFGDGENIAIGPCTENSNQVINFINTRFIEHKLNQGCFLGHAAGVIQHGRGLAIAGFSGMGKSTLALHLMSMGATFVSNDRVMVKESGEQVTFYGVAKQPRINPGTALNNPDLLPIIPLEERDHFLSISKAKLWDLEHKYDALIHECFGPEKFILRASMNALVILNWQRDESETVIKVVDPLKRKDLLPAFTKETGLFYIPDSPAKIKDQNIEDYAKLLSKTTVIEISGGVDFDMAAKICHKFMTRGTFQPTTAKHA
ncbi:HprK-related kinase B [Maridesulfovibrio frigidus]|uniref:HprK-related kinase B n=1 Tax=Maridesulfovibrio frigidus TaxID=340956 RepID=UPI00054D8EF4|nr:HprK-related kinase B [Maridesulfovibrio frigidus]